MSAQYLRSLVTITSDEEREEEDLDLELDDPAAKRLIVPSSVFIDLKDDGVHVTIRLDEDEYKRGGVPSSG